MPFTFFLLLASAAAQHPADSGHFAYVLQLGREYVNDHALVEDRGVMHLIYTMGDFSIRPWSSPGNEIELGHATSSDMVEWTRRAPVLRIGGEGSPDAAHIYAPSVLRVGDRYHMFYTGNARGFFSGERILTATSSDLQTWERSGASPFLPDSSWAAYHPPGYDSGAGGPVSFRDPFLLRLDDGTFICYYVARMRDGAGEPARACVAAATSPDMITWTDRGPVLTRPVADTTDINPYSHPESPCVVVRNGRYHLFWKGGSGTRHAMSDDPLDFESAEETLIATSHASKIFQWRSRWYITSCSRNVNDVTHTQSDRTRGLYIAGIEWVDDRPVVVPMHVPSAAPSAGDVVRRLWLE